MAQPVHPKPSKPTFLLLIPFRPTLPCSIAVLALLCLAGYYALHQHHNRRLPKPTTIDPPYLFLNSSDPSFISSALRSLTRGPHLAGTRGAHRTAQYVLAQLQSAGLPAHVADYEALLSYPLKASLSAHFANGTSTAFVLAEPAEPGQGASRVVPPYHAYAPSGAASRVPAVYANYGREEDYRALGVSVRGFIAVVRRGGGPRGEVVRRAAREGAVAVLMYAEGEKFRDGVERGTVMTGLGDPLTPGWAHVDGGEALDEDDPTVRERFPSIPSMPISAETAGEILKTLGGSGFPEEWRDNTLNHVWGWVGPGPTTLSFSYQEERRIAKIQNVLAVVRGQEEPDRYVLLGNHRDAWTYGAVDPNSGTAALLDIARRLGILLRSGWTPRRSIILCSWDAEEFGMIGSTEWVEQNLETLKSKAVAYLNVDCAVQGPGFFAGATPQLDALLVEITKKINDPDSGGMTVYQSWVATNAGISIGRLSGVESDFAAFVQHAGVPSVDLYYGKDFPVYHTSFDSYDWMEKYGDRLFHRHVAVAGIWGLLALHLADDLVLPFDYLSYAAQLQEHTKELTALLDAAIHLRAIHTAIEELLAAAHEAGEESKKLREQDSLADSSNIRLRAFNDRLMLAERGFLEAEGLKGREWFKHLIYGPSSDYNPKLSFFPGIGDAISRSRKMSKREGQAAIQHEVWRVARAIQRAAIVLRGDLT